MAGLFGKPSYSVKTEVYTGIQVSTSTYGQCIPYVAGRQRVPFNLLWYGNFQSHKQNQNSGKGGGGGSNTTYTYSAAFAAALCLGPIKNVYTVWHDKAIVTLKFENLALSLGGSAPPIWSGYPSNTPANQLIPYDRQAYVASSNYNFGSSATMPNLTFEVEGPIGGFNNGAGMLDADPSAWIPHYLQDPVIGAGFQGTIAPLQGTTNSYQAYCMSLGLLTSPYENTQRAATDCIKEVLQITNSEVVLSVGTLRIIPYADQPVSATTPDGTSWSYTPNLTPVFVFTDSDYIPDPGEPPVKLTRKPLAGTYNIANVEYVDRTNYYNTAPVNISDLDDIAKHGPRVMPTLTWHQITSAQTAKMAGQLYLQFQLYERNTYEFKVRLDYSLLEPMDYVSINDSNLGLINQLVRILEIDDSEEDVITIKAMKIPGTVRSTPQYNWNAAQGYSANYALSPGSVLAPEIFQMPPIPAVMGGNSIDVGIAVTGQNNGLWKGCNVFCSVDGGSTYGLVGVVPAACRYGIINQDNTTSINITLYNTSETLGSDAGGSNIVQLCLLDAGTNVEIIAFTTAQLTGPGQYTLSGLQRGLYGTLEITHNTGVRFVRLDENIFQCPFDPGQAGQTVLFKFCSFNTWGQAVEDIANVTAYSYTIAGSASIGEVALVPRGNIVSFNLPSGTMVYRTDGGGAWNADIISNRVFPNGGSVFARYGSGGAMAVGLVTQADINAGHLNPGSNMAYSIYFHADTNQVLICEETNVIVLFPNAPALDDWAEIVYDGYLIKYIYNGSIFRTVQKAGLQLYGAVAIWTGGGGPAPGIFSDVRMSSSLLSTPISWITTGTAFVNDTTIGKVNSGETGYTGHAYTIVGYQGCHLSFKVSQLSNGVNDQFVIGISTSPSTATGLDAQYGYGVAHDGTIGYWESGAYIFLEVFDLNSVYALVYDDNANTVTYYKNGIATGRIINGVPKTTFYATCWCAVPGASLNTVEFGPGTNLKINDTGQINLAAVTAIYNTTLVGPSNIFVANNGNTPVLLAQLSVPSIKYDATYVVTITGTVDHHLPSAQSSAYVAATTIPMATAQFTTGNQISRNPSTALPDAGGSFALEQTIFVSAGSGNTIYLYGFCGGVGSPSGAFVNIYNVSLKVEVIKR